MKRQQASNSTFIYAHMSKYQAQSNPSDKHLINITDEELAKKGMVQRQLVRQQAVLQLTHYIIVEIMGMCLCVCDYLLLSASSSLAYACARLSIVYPLDYITLHALTPGVTYCFFIKSSLHFQSNPGSVTQASIILLESKLKSSCSQANLIEQMDKSSILYFWI